MSRIGKRGIKIGDSIYVKRNNKWSFDEGVHKVEQIHVSNGTPMCENKHGLSLWIWEDDTWRTLFKGICNDCTSSCKEDNKKQCPFFLYGGEIR